MKYLLILLLFSCNVNIDTIDASSEGPLEKEREWPACLPVEECTSGYPFAACTLQDRITSVYDDCGRQCMICNPNHHQVSNCAHPFYPNKICVITCSSCKGN